MILLERKACCHFANAFLNRLQLIWLLSRIKISKLSKKCFLAKSSSVNASISDNIFYVGQVNSASWTNQGPQQWDQTGSGDEQFPHSTIPQDPYNQMDQQGQLQQGSVLYTTLTHVSC